MLEYPFTIAYRPGTLHSVADAHIRCSARSAPITNFKAIKKLYESMGHPGAIQLCAYILQFHEVSRNDVLELTGPMRLKPCFSNLHLIYATTPWQRISIDFMRPKASNARNHYLPRHNYWRILSEPSCSSCTQSINPNSDNMLIISLYFISLVLLRMYTVTTWSSSLSILSLWSP